MLGGTNGRVPTAQNDIDLGGDQSPGDIREPLRAEPVAARIDVEVLAQREPDLPQLLEERDILWRIPGTCEQGAEAVDPARFLRALYDRQGKGAEGKRHVAQDGAARDHAITWSPASAANAAVSSRGERTRASGLLYCEVGLAGRKATRRVPRCP